MNIPKTILLVVALNVGCAGCDLPQPAILVDVESSDGTEHEATSIDEHYARAFDLDDEEVEFPITITATARLKTVHYYAENERGLDQLGTSQNFMPETCSESSSFECDGETCVGEFEMHAAGACVFEFVGIAGNGQDISDCWSFSLTDGPQTRDEVEAAISDCLY